MGFKPDYLGGWRWEDENTTAKPSYTWNDSTTPVPPKNVGWSHTLPDSYTIPAAAGWECPKCGRVNAPWLATCPCFMEHGPVIKWTSSSAGVCEEKE